MASPTSWLYYIAHLTVRPIYNYLQILVEERTCDIFDDWASLHRTFRNMHITEHNKTFRFDVSAQGSPSLCTLYQ